MNEQISLAVSLFVWFPTPRNSNILRTQRWWCSKWVFSGGDGGFSLFFGDEPFWLPPKKCYVIVCFNGLFYQAATVSSHVSMGMRTSKVLAWMAFSWKLRNFSIEKNTLRISPQVLWLRWSLSVSVIESKGTPWFENVVHYSYHPCISCTVFSWNTYQMFVHVPWMIWMAIGAFQEPAWYSSKDLPQVWLWGFGLTCKTCSKMFDFDRQTVYVNM